MRARTRVEERDGGAEEGPLRLCAVSRVHKPPEELIRFVAGPDGAIVPDLARRLPGRGVWVDATREAVDAAAGIGVVDDVHHGLLAEGVLHGIVHDIEHRHELALVPELDLPEREPARGH